MPYLTNRQRINLKQLSIDKGYETAVGTLADEDVFIVHDSSSADNFPVSGSTVKRYAESARASNPIYLYDSSVYLSSPVDGQARLQADNSAQITGSVVVLASTTNESGSIWLHANGGTSESILLRSDQGTSATEGSASVQLLSDAGGIGLKSGLNGAGAVRITADGGTSESIILHSDQGTGASAATESDASIQMISDVGGIGMLSGLNAANAIRLEADGGTAETIIIHANQGTAAAEGVASVQLLSDDGGIGIKAGVDAAGAVRITADGGTSETIIIHSDLGTGDDSIHLISDAGGITMQADVATFSSTAQYDPLVSIKNTSNDADGARLRFVKDKGAAGADNDVAGLIEFYADDDNQDQVKFAEIKAQVADATNGEEGGKLTLSVASHNGTSTAGLVLSDGSASGEVDVTIGAGTNSVTTIAGDLTVTGTTTTVNQTVVNVQNAFVFEGATADSFETTLSIVDPTADHTYYLPDLGSTGDTGYVMAFSADPGTSGLINATAAEIHAVADVSAGATYAETVAVASDHFLFRDGGATGATKVESLAHYAEKLVGVGGGSVSSSGLSASSGVVSFKGFKQQIFMSASADGATAVTKGHYILNADTVRNDYLKLDTDGAASTVMSGSSNANGVPHLQVYLNGMLLRSGSTNFAGESAWVNNSADDYMYIAHTGGTGAKATGTILILSSSLDPDDVVIVRWLQG